MRFDSWEFSLNVPEERADEVTVIRLPALEGGLRTMLPGSSGVGLAVSRACLQDPARRTAAVSLVQKILSQEGMAGLITSAGGSLAEQMALVNQSIEGTCGILYDLNPEGFDDWAESTISGLMGEAESES